MDGSKYPFLPWCVNSYDTDTIRIQDENYFRDFEKPLGFILENERAATYEENYKTMVRDKDPHPHFFGTYFSNPASVMYYLMRLEPFKSAWGILHPKMSESPERVFYSLVKHYKSITTVSQDLKESLPEFYFQPEFFMNVNNVHFENQPNEDWRFNQFELPKWAKNNPFNFVYINRLLLESDQVNQGINKWINLTFGSCLSGKKAFENKNVYHPMVYFESVSKKLKSAPVKEYQALYSQIYHFGQAPQKVFDSDHPEKAVMSSVLKKACFSDKNSKPFVVIHRMEENLKIGQILGSEINISSDTITVCSNSLIRKYKYSIGKNKENKVEKVGLTLNKASEVNRLSGLLSSFYFGNKTIPMAYDSNSSVDLFYL